MKPGHPAQLDFSTFSGFLHPSFTTGCSSRAPLGPVEVAASDAAVSAVGVAARGVVVHLHLNERDGKVSEIAVLHRRHLLKTAAIIGAVSAFPQVKLALAQSPLRRTPDQVLGPFFPLGKKPDPGGDLTRLPGKSGRAAGQVLNVMGRVLNVNGEPVRGAKVEV
jgi:hypothetical protein